MKVQILTALILIFLTGSPLNAQPANASFLHYTTDQGLSNDHITGVTKDHFGFLWVSTTNGLNRFDGRTFKTFHHDPKDDRSLIHDDITGITLAPDGWLWIATAHGLCKLDPQWLTIIRIPLPENADSLTNDITTHVAFDSKGMAWTTTDNGIYQINSLTGNIEAFYETDIPTLGWYRMMIDSQDRLLLLKHNLRRFDPRTKSYKFFKGSKPGLMFGALSLATDPSGQLWAGTWSEGIWKYNPELDEFEPYFAPESLMMMVMPDKTSSGRPFFWIGGGNSGLAVFYPDKMEMIQFISNPEDPFTHNNYLATSFFKDTVSGDVWIGTEVGLEQYAPATIRFERAMIPTEKDMGQFSLVSGVVHDNTDITGQRYFISVWGTGMFEWNKTTGLFTRMRSATQMTGGNIYNILQSSDGLVWGCMKGVIGRYDPRTSSWKDYKPPFKYPERNNNLPSGWQDKKGNIWFGSNKEGLFKYNPIEDRIEQAFYKEEWAAQDGSLNVMSISEDSQGRLWLAANSSGLIRFDPATREAVRFKYANQNGPLLCNSVQIARNKKIYVSCYSDFLELDSEGKLLQHFNQQNGLKTNRIYFMVEDLQGKIWFNSAYLLHCFDPATSTFTYYGKPDGLFSNTITDALSITPGGEIFVGFQNALNFFYPDRLRRNPQPPPIAVTSIKVMNKERSVVTSDGDTFLMLKPNEDFFEVEFAALNFNQQERNQYAYQLEGFNKDWVYTERPVATFTNLDGGTYLLRMKAANNDGVWNEKGTTLEIRVNPSFYKTRWFPLLLAMAIALIGLALLWYRRHQRKRLEKFREGLARDLHDEMGSTLSSIRFFSDYANQQIGTEKPLVTPMLQRISQSATNLSESMQDIVWAMKTDHDHLEDLAAHMTEFGLRLLEARNIRFKTHISEGFSGKQLHPEVRRNIYLIFKEAINNIAKYSEASEVELHFALKRGLLLMKIKDNGKGFDLDSLQVEGTGNGLKNMKKRAAEIGGKLAIVSQPAAGASIELRVEV